MPSMSTANPPPIPPIPPISGDLLLNVFTHRSLMFSGAPENEEYGDNERLAQLGAQILEMTVTFFLFAKRPMITATEIVTQREEILSDAEVERWIEMYHLREKLRCAPDALETLKTPKEARLLFASYVGAVYVQSGVDPIQEWISRLIDPDAEPPAAPGATPPQNVHPNPPPPYAQQTHSGPAPPSSPPPPLPAAAPPTGMASLALFNQTASQNRMSVVYNPEMVGPPHAPRWTVRCVVDGAEKGIGVGRNQKAAKEEAARQAMVALGWASAPQY